MSTSTPESPKAQPVRPATSTGKSLAQKAEDHALVSVPAEERRSGWKLSITTVGLVTALVIFAIAGFSVILAGFRNAVIGGSVVGVLGFLLGNLLGRMAHRTGMSSTITSRFFGLGLKGSALGAGIFAFMILGFLALESALLYEGSLIYFGWEDTWTTKIGLYGLLTLFWIALAIFGLPLVMRASAVLLVVTVVVAILVVIRNFTDGGATWSMVFQSKGVVPGGNWAQIEAVMGLTGATAAAIALVTTDIARFARTPKDVTILAASGPVVQNVVMTVLGALVVVGAMPTMIAHLMKQDPSLTAEAAGGMAGGMAMANTGAFFVVVLGLLGMVTIYATQAKAQGMNAYTSSLALVNICHALFNWKAPRALMVVVGNVIALIFIAVGILGHFSEWLSHLGAMTFALAGVMIADYYLVRKGHFDHSTHKIENFNWAGIITLVASASLGGFLMIADIWPLGFVASLIAPLALYPALRKALPEGSGTGFVAEEEALLEAH